MIFDELENGKTKFYLISDKDTAIEAIKEIEKQNKHMTDIIFLDKIKPEDVQKNIFK